MKKVKYMFLGVVLGYLISMFSDNTLQADISGCACNKHGSKGTVSWNPVYVKIVK